MSRALALRGDNIIDLAGPSTRRGEQMRAAPARTGTLWFEGGRVVDGGSSADAEVDASGLTVVPGFVDCHTHLPFFGWRGDEDLARLSGVRYQDIHGRSGGIFRSASMLADASDEEVLAFSTRLATEMLRHGTTTFETKSGYGLSVDAEMRQLRLGRSLAERVPQCVVATCLAAHAVPAGMSEEEWTGIAAAELLPAAAAEGLCRAVDVYVESIAFHLDHAARLATAAEGLGLAMRIHADQLSDGGAGSFAASRHFRSADHLNHLSLDAVDDFAGSETAAVLLPGATFTLRQAEKPPARELIDAGAIVALGTDLNPGTSPIHSLPFAMVLACRLYGLDPLEALIAATVNSAYVLGLEDEVGRLEPGMRADAVVLATANVEDFVYRPDENFVAIVICGGAIVHVAPGFEGCVTTPPSP
ncbi:MAG: imidazolonepropionase [Actinomycetota bacterium]